MAPWSSYGIADFLMYSPRTWWRLVERYNEGWWPQQVFGIVGAALLLWAVHAREGTRDRAAFLLLAAAWAWVGWAFHARVHAQVSLAAPALAAASALQVLLLLATSWLARPAPSVPRAPAVHASALLLAGAALLMPLAFALLAPRGSGWRSAEVFGFMPDPTALATLALLLAAAGTPRWLRALAAVIPLLSLAWSGAMRWAMAAQ